MDKVKALLQLARPHQYLKNGFVWLPLFFGYNEMQNPQAILHTVYVFIVFCMAASSIYIINDLKDIAEDRQHPVKQFRPLAIGVVSKYEAVFLSLVLMCLAVLISFVLLPDVLLIVGGYILLNLVYSNALKHLTIVDIVCIAVGFVLRVIAGGIVASVPISPWIVIMTFLLALFLALAKRRDDLKLVENGLNVRKSIDGYNQEFVSLSMVVMASVIIVSYLLYTVSPEVIEKHGTSHLYLSSFWVIIGLLRYMQIVFVEQKGGSPTLVLINDYFLQSVIVLWLISIYLLLYGL